MLEVDDMVRMKKPDWKCVFTYVQSFYRRFRNGRDLPTAPPQRSKTIAVGAHEAREISSKLTLQPNIQVSLEKNLNRSIDHEIAQVGMLTCVKFFEEKDKNKAKRSAKLLRSESDAINVLLLARDQSGWRRTATAVCC